MPNFNLKLYSFEKEGKGVEIDEKKPFGPLYVFILYFRNFLRMTVHNLTYFAVLLPIVTVLVSSVIIMLGEDTIRAIINAESFQSFNQNYPWVMILVNIYSFFTHSYIGMFIGALLFAAAALAFGPISAGMAYVMRNTSREEHVFISDIFSVAWENKKQAIPLGLLDIGAVYAIAIYFFGDFSGMNVGYAMLMDFLKYFALLIFVFYLVVRIYAYTIMVSFYMDFKDIIKNAVILTYANLPYTLVVWFTMIAVIFVNIILPLPSLLLVPLFDFSFTLLACHYACYKPIDKYMIRPALENQENE